MPDEGQQGVRFIRSGAYKGRNIAIFTSGGDSQVCHCKFIVNIHNKFSIAYVFRF